MSTSINTANTRQTKTLADVKINVKLKLSALWIALMFIYLYVDFFALFQPGGLESILAGNMGPFSVTQMALLSAMLLMTVPSVMVFLSLALPATINRWTNLVVAVLYVAVAIGTVIGETWAYYLFGGAVELVLLGTILWHAWTWPAARE